MSYLDRKDLLSADLMTRSITKEGSIKYYNTDKNVANIYMKLMATSSDGVQKEVAVDEASNYTVKIDVIKPKTNQIRTVPGVLNTDLPDETCAIWKFELGEDFTNQIGEAICQAYVKNATQNLTMKYFAYTVEADKLTGLNSEIVTDPDLPILKQLIQEVKETAQTVNNIDDVNITDTKTFSNKKIEEKFSGVDAQFNTIVPYRDCKKGANIEISTQADYNNLKTLIDKAVSCGIDSFAIIVSHAINVYTDNTMSGMNTTVTTVLQQVINYCNSINVHVHVRCTIYTLDGHGFQVYPTDVNLWLDNWKNILLQYCSLIYPLNVREISISNEMRTLTNGNYDKWQEIITSIKTLYPQMKVGTNFNIYDYKTDIVHDLFDILGFNFYPCLTKKGMSESEINLKRSFYYDLYNDELIPSLLKLRNDYPNKQIILTEIGTWSDATSLYQTWKNSYPNPIYDENTQELYYKLFMELLYKNNTVLDGMYLFIVVENTHRLEGYCFFNKKAENIVKNYWLGV